MRGWDWALICLAAAWLLALVWIGAPGNNLLIALWSQTMAAWMQAIGSVVAIIAAIWVAEGGRRDALLRGWVGSTNSALIAATYLISILERARGHSQRSEWNDGILYLIRREVDGAIGILDRIDPGQLPNANAAGSMVNVVKLAHNASACLLVVERGMATRQPIPEALFDEIVEDTKKATDLLTASAKATLDIARQAGI